MTGAVSIAEDHLAKLLVERQILTADEGEHWLQMAKDEGLFLEQILERESVFDDAELLTMLENHYFCPSIDPRTAEIDPAVIAKLPYRLAVRHLALPIARDGSQLRVALAIPDSPRASEAVQQATMCRVQPLVALRHHLQEALEERYRDERIRIQAADVAKATGGSGDTGSRKARFRDTLAHEVGGDPDTSAARKPGIKVEGEPVAIVDKMLESAYRRSATDIHVEPRDKELVVRFRIDGILHQVARLPVELTAQITSRLKILGRMDISEKRLPQDGRFTMSNGDDMFDLRVSSLPSQFGEKIVLRILRKDASLLELANLHIPASVSKHHQEMLDRPLGMFLVTGPTGSGKTTTLYSTLASLDRETVNVITLEDPIEYSLPGITQVQVNPASGLTFAVALESFLRQDPDVILVGEIRDQKTAEIAARAALTGHKVFSTLHTNDACQAVMRLIDMKVPPYLVTATLCGVVAQRLVRTVCEDCREGYEANETELALLDYPKEKMLQRGTGCRTCAGTGYRGRMALFEYFKMEDNLHRLVLERCSPYALRTAARRNGMVPMAEFGKRLAIEGKTTVAELHRVLFAEDEREQLCHGCQQPVSVEFSVCPFCRQVLQESCPSCNRAVDPSWEACPGCGDAIEREWKKVYCKGCAAPLDDAWLSCPYCGEGKS